MKWFDRWLIKKVHWANRHPVDDSIQIKMLKENALNAISIGQAIHATPRGDRLDTVPDLNFKMFRAENGYVMEVRCHDRKTDRQHVNLHVIGEEQDLGTAISHIITVESLKVN